MRTQVAIIGAGPAGLLLSQVLHQEGVRCVTGIRAGLHAQPAAQPLLLAGAAGASDFDQRAQEFELEYLRSSHHAQAALAEQYAGLPL